MSCAGLQPMVLFFAPLTRSVTVLHPGLSQHPSFSLSNPSQLCLNLTPSRSWPEIKLQPLARIQNWVVHMAYSLPLPFADYMSCPCLADSRSRGIGRVLLGPALPSTLTVNVPRLAQMAPDLLIHVFQSKSK